MTEPVPPEVLLATRESLHRVAEHLLAAARKRDSGDITLLPAPGGFRTPELSDGSALSVVGADVVVAGADGGERREPLTTLARAAAFAGVRPGFPWTKHPPTTPFEPDAALAVDERAAAALASWFALGADALAALAVELADEDPSEPQLFPEHFDVGLTAGAVNYGCSPGDADIPEPYAYVGPHTPPPADDDRWNAPFGAYRTWHEVTDRAQALDFFLACHEALGSA